MIPNSEYDQRRLESNLKILRYLEWTLNSQPHLRFHQAMQALDVQQRTSAGTLVDHFYEEPWETLKRIEP